jgi:hypothetical protein
MCKLMERIQGAKGFNDKYMAIWGRSGAVSPLLRQIGVSRDARECGLTNMSQGGYASPSCDIGTRLANRRSSTLVVMKMMSGEDSSILDMVIRPPCDDRIPEFLCVLSP